MAVSLHSNYVNRLETLTELKRLVDYFLLEAVEVDRLVDRCNY